MDIFAHGLWGGVIGKAVRRFSPENQKTEISPWWTGFWATFPDLLAFVPLAAVIAFEYMFGDTGGNQTRFLYSLGHSAVTWAVVFLVVWLIARRPRLELLGWLSHVGIDVFTHPIDRYPTPFLWPFSDFAVDGTRWATPEFMIINYVLLLAALFLLRDHKNPFLGLHAMSPTRKILLALLFIVSFGVLIR